MSEKREGIFTPDQEKLLDDLKKWDNPLVEAGDGMAIRMADNIGLEAIKKEFLKKYPNAEDDLYNIVDGLMLVVESAIKSSPE